MSWASAKDDVCFLTGAIRNTRQTRADTPEQQWYIQAGTTHIQVAGSTLCADAGEESTEVGDLDKVDVN